jgi:hypothetical protein
LSRQRVTRGNSTTKQTPMPSPLRPAHQTPLDHKRCKPDRNGAPKHATANSAQRRGKPSHSTHSGAWSRWSSATEVASGHESHTSPPRGRIGAAATVTEVTATVSTQRQLPTSERPTERRRCNLAVARCANRKREPKHRPMPSDDTAEAGRQNSPHRGHENTFPRFGALQRNQIRKSLSTGLPHRHLPLSGFLTLSAV